MPVLDLVGLLREHREGAVLLEVEVPLHSIEWFSMLRCYSSQL
jgi:hypothetical protein